MTGRYYYTVSIPYTSHRNEWTPTSPTGPFSTLQRGSFQRVEQAHAWADKHIPGRRYGIRRIDTTGTEPEQSTLVWAGTAFANCEVCGKGAEALEHGFGRDFTHVFEPQL